MLNHRFSAMTLASGALSLALLAASTGASTAREYNSDRSWSGNGRVETTPSYPRRGNPEAGGSDGDRGWSHDNDRRFGDGYGRRHGGSGYNPWWRSSRYAEDYYGYDQPRRHRRHWWNRNW